MPGNGESLRERQSPERPAVDHGVWCRADDRGGPEITLHGPRHGAATLGLAAGLDIKMISAIRRRGSTSTTSDLYPSILPESLKTQ
jgi:integrase